MSRQIRALVQGNVVAVIAVLSGVAVLVLWPSVATHLFQTQGLDPHGACLLWDPGLVGLHLTSDLLIGSAYLAISTTLVYLVYRARNAIPFHWVFLAFGTFIIACGTTHFMEVLTLWTPVYWLAGVVKAVTAIASVTTAVILPPLVPQALRLIQSARLSEQRQGQLATANSELDSQRRQLAAANAELAALYAASQQARDLLQGELDSRSHDVTALAAELAGRNRELAGTLATLQVREVALEQSVSAAEGAIRARDEFLLVAAHELRTPITVLRGLAELHLRQLRKLGPPDPARLNRALETMASHTIKLSRLVDQLLDVSRVAGGRLTLDSRPTDLTQLVTEVVAARQNTLDPSHTLTISAPPGVTADVDALRLEQVLTNLLDNAVKYSPQGGPVEVALTQPTPTEIDIVVTDRGIGIPPEQRNAIFDRFYRAHAAEYYSGLGLGLYVSRQIIELHGGTIRAEFPTAGGTRFIVRLPTQPPTVPRGLEN